MGKRASGGGRRTAAARLGDDTVGGDWARDNSPSWLREAADSAETPTDISKMTRRVNREMDQNLDRQDGWKVGAALQLIRDTKERLAADRVRPRSRLEQRADNFFNQRDSNGRAVRRPRSQ